MDKGFGSLQEFNYVEGKNLIINSLARPGDNATGFAAFEYSISGQMAGIVTAGLITKSLALSGSDRAPRAIRGRPPK
jgi:hypothetical protein